MTELVRINFKSPSLVTGLTSAKGDVIVGDTTGLTNITVGSDGQFLSANSATASGLEWSALGAGSSSTEQILYNNSGTITGSSTMQYDPATDNIILGTNSTNVGSADNIVIGGINMVSTAAVGSITISAISSAETYGNWSPQDERIQMFARNSGGITNGVGITTGAGANLRSMTTIGNVSNNGLSWSYAPATAGDWGTFPTSVSNALDMLSSNYGTFVPTFVNVSGTSARAAGDVLYMRIGRMVNVAMRCDFTLTATTFSVDITAASLPGGSLISCSGTGSAGFGSVTNAHVSDSSGNARIFGRASSTGTMSFWITFMYF
jgi:hypothetical protein